MSQSELEACMNDPELALNNLELLLASVNSDDESIANPALESLENCGVPRTEHVELLLNYLKDANSQRVYWAATLIGRQLADDSVPGFGANQRLQECFATRLVDPSLAESAQERICWAIGNLTMVSPELRNVLVAVSAHATPRMQRLIEAALSKA
ncbi:MAG: hypothetical protein MUC83_12910 [Pirellula sp.]|jgi:hypothetical protein|nr:hypothetical protein [Pirellula sp.]